MLPERVDAGLLGWLHGLPWPVTIVVHANHANEFDPAVDAAMAALRATGASLLNQAVLLRGVNDSVDALADLCERGHAAGVLPYYLHQLDRVAGAAHFEVPDGEALSLHAALAARLPGYLVPRLVREIAGEPGKTPLQAAIGRIAPADIDEAAVGATRDNAAANGVKLNAVGLPDAAQGVYDTVLANILATPLKVLAPLLCQYVAPGGALVLAGVLERQTAELQQAYAEYLPLEVADTEDGWVLLVARRA